MSRSSVRGSSPSINTYRPGAGFGVRAELIALCDVDMARAQSVASEFGVATAYNDVNDMLNSEHPDIVDVCTPPATHADIAVRALGAGAHVLIEKPMAPTLEECDRIVDAATAADSYVGVAHSELFYPCMLEAKERVRRGDIGEFKGMRIFRSTPVDYMTAHEDHWANKLPGGPIGETGPHVAYLTQEFINPGSRCLGTCQEANEAVSLVAFR